MKLTRRNFLIASIGGAAGMHATPLPWKLMDDVAIWTQNWPWLTVPPEGEFTKENSLCKLCPGGCGIEVRKVDDRPVKIEGRAEYPANPGGICPLGAGGLQLLYNENLRYTSPMKRIGPRGAGTFQNISWDEALKELANRIAGLRKDDRPEALAAIDGSGLRSSMSLMVQRLLEAVGSPNYMTQSSGEETYTQANMLMMGNHGPMAYDIEKADFILSFGCGLIEGWGAPGRMFNAWGNWRDSSAKKSVKIVQVESRASNTASKSDQWVAPYPGTETALALGIAHVMIKEKLYSKKFVESHTFGFEDWKSNGGKKHMGFKTLVLKKYTPEMVAKVTGLSAEKITHLGREFGKAKAPLALSGKGKGHLNGSLLEFMAIQSLNALSGNLNQPGGVFIHETIPLKPWPSLMPDPLAEKGLGKVRIDLAGSERYPFSASHIANFAEAINNSPKSPVDTLLVFSANPAFTTPDCGGFQRALKKIPFIVSFSPYRDETSLMADLILPDHTYLEKVDDVVWPSGLQYPLYGLTQPVVEPLYNTRNSGDVIIQLAGLVGGPVASAFPWKNYEDSLKERAAGLKDSGGSWKEIKSKGFYSRPNHKFQNFDAIFKTPTGRFEFFSSRMELVIKELSKKSSEEVVLKGLGITVQGDEAFMPHYEPATAKESGLTMVPYELINLSSGWLPNPPYLKKTLFDHQLRKDDSFIEINPATAANAGLQEGDRVIIKSDKGKLRARVHLFEGAMPDVSYLPLGLGHWAYDDFHQGKGVNPNEIIDGPKDPVSGNAIWWKTPIKIEKV